MNRKEIKDKIAQLISTGITKSEVFSQLSGQGIKDSRLAYFIASYADPELCAANKVHVRILLGLTYLQAFLGFFVGYFIGMQIGPVASWITGVLIASLMLWFAWGYHKNKVVFYNATIILTIIQLPQQLNGFSETPIAATVGIAIGVGLASYTWYVRQKIFPDFLFVTPKKINGVYAFSN
ncbi:MAG: hypothetical protein ABI171_19715 [Collimonas sp.]|uniref:hypothetical protein n=1 Tax=Collimonas sp. TaxID=1963772 RepID=UPI003267146E